MMDNQFEIEKEYLALLINKPDLLDIVQIKPSFLSDYKNKTIFTDILNCYKEYKVISIPKILEKNPSFDIDYYTELLTDTFYHETNWKQQLVLSEESILSNFKTNYVKELIHNYENGKVSYDELTNKIRNVDDFRLSYQTQILSKEEIRNEIKDKSVISLKVFPKLNNVLQLVHGDFVVIGALTGHGKSSFLLNLMVDLMEEYQCIYFNMEMSKSTIYKRILSIISNIPVKYVNNPETPYQEELLNSAYEVIEKSKVIIEHQANDIKTIKKILATNKVINKHTILFLDHIGLIKANNSKSLYENSTEIAKELRQMCLEYDCTIISASQLNRSAYSNELSISMLKDSGEIENSSSKTILLHPFKDDELITELDIEVAKNRDGMTGIIIMNYDKGKQIFKERVVN